MWPGRLIEGKDLHGPVLRVLRQVTSQVAFDPIYVLVAL